MALSYVKIPAVSLGEDNHGHSELDGALESSAHTPKFNPDRSEFKKSLLGKERKSGREIPRM